MYGSRHDSLGVIFPSVHAFLVMEANPSIRVVLRVFMNFVARVRQLYEQEPREPDTSSRLGVYVRRWVRWVRAGLSVGTLDPHRCPARCDALITLDAEGGHGG
jgi:hypothetical protein